MEIRLLVAVVLFVAVHEAVSQVQTITPVVNNVGNGADIQDVPVIKEKPKKVIRYKLIRMSDEDIRKEEEAKKKKVLLDAVHKEWKKKLFPCKDYSPICSRYKNIWNPGVAQCRDVWMQRNCRESCGLCMVPIGVFLGCNDMQHCKALGSNACVHKWVLETCRSMCGSCDGSKGRKNARVGASSVFVGKKKSIVSSKHVSSKHQQKVKTVDEAVKNQHKPLEIKETEEDKEEEKEEKEAEDTEEQGSSADNMEVEGSGQDENTVESKDESEAEKPEAEEKVVKAPEPHKDTPKKIKVSKKPVPNTKIHHLKHHRKHHHKSRHAKKPENPIKALIKKHKKHTKS